MNKRLMKRRQAHTMRTPIHRLKLGSISTTIRAGVPMTEGVGVTKGVDVSIKVVSIDIVIELTGVGVIEPVVRDEVEDIQQLGLYSNSV